MIYKYCVLVFFFFFHLHRDLEFLIVCLFDNYIRRANIIYKKRKYDARCPWDFNEKETGY